MRLTFSLILATVVQVAVAWAQPITVSGWVDRVNTRESTITIRSLGGAREIAVAPRAVIRVNGSVTRLAQLPINSRVNILALKGSGGELHATEILAASRTGEVAATYPPGSVVSGRIIRVNVPMNEVTVRTTSGAYTVPLGHAPIYRNGKRISIDELRSGQRLRVERALPTQASTDYVTRSAYVVSSTYRGAPRAQRQAGFRETWMQGGYYDRQYPHVSVNVDQTGLAATGVLANGRVLVPVRELAERLQGTVYWDPEMKTAWIAFTEEGRTLRLTADSSVADIYSYEADSAHRAGRLLDSHRLIHPPLLMDGHLVAPLAALARVANASVQFMPDQGQVHVQSAPAGQTARR